MLVILDTTAIMNDPQCNGTAWRTLAHGAAAWDVSLFVPEVVIIEAVAGYRRRISDATAALDGWGRKHAGPLGLGNFQKEVTETLDRASTSYRSTLEGTLAELKAEIVSPPDVDHVVLVERAANRRKPCNSNGDGYRDSLNWLTVLSIANKYSDEHIIWVSNNSNDFANDDGDGLHPDLLAELEEKGVADRVIWVRAIPDLVLHLAANNNMENASDIDAIQARLKDSAFKEFIMSEVLSGSVGMQVDPRECALPPATSAASILAVGAINEISLTARGSIGEAGAVVEFSVKADATVQIRYPAGKLSDTVLAEIPLDGTESAGQVVKSLEFSGILTLDKYDRPTGGELTRVFATEDDPGFLLWAMADLLGRSRDTRSLATQLAAISPDAYKNLFPPLPAGAALNLFPQVAPDYYKNLLPTIPAGTLASLFPRVTSDYYKNMLSMIPAGTLTNLFPPVSSDYYKYLLPTIPPGTLANLFPKIPPGFLSSFASDQNKPGDMDEPEEKPSEEPPEGSSESGEA